MRRSLIYALLLLATVAAVVVWLSNDPYYQALCELSRATQVVEQYDLFAAAPQEIKYGGAAGLVSVLDDYSAWHDHATDTVIRRQARGYYGGFGIEIVRFGDTTVVWRVFPRSPAETAGVRMGDRLLAADTIRLVGQTLDSVHYHLMTIPRATVALEVYRPADQSRYTIPCRRGEIDVGTVDVWGTVGDIAYLTIGAFNLRTASALRTALDTLTRNGATRFIVDLRGNPGGLLQAAIDCAQLFLPEDGPIVSVSGQHPREVVRGKRGPYPAGPLVLLVDEGSASGSELLAGCLQDWDRAVLVGAPTFGKGFVQNLFPLREQSSLRLTIGQYRTPSGRTFYRPDSLAAPDTGRYTSLVSGRAVKGGGQIFPDVEASDLKCPVYLHAFLRRQGPFDFTVGLLDSDSLPALDYELAARFWQSRHAQFESQLESRLDEMAPDLLLRSTDWQRTVADAASRERAFDLEAGRDCVLYVISRHLVRAGRSVPLLDEPLLSTDPALAEAVSILRSPDRYEAILTGRSRDRGAEPSGPS